jgi:hypothetical protein
MAGYIVTASILIAAAGRPAAAPAVVPYDSLMEERVSVDGYVDLEEDEYPASFANPATGITVYWGYDDSCIYVALTSRGKGWLGVGFGSPVMHEANMVVGFYSEESSGVYNVVGQQHVHSPVPESSSVLEEYDIDFDDETGLVTLEFAYPLHWPSVKGTAVSGLEPNDTYDLILARNARTVSLSEQHAQHSQLKFRLAENPKLSRTGQSDKE